MLAEQVARSIVQRAQELYDARVYADAKQLAVEALARSPKGAAAEHAKFLIKMVDEKLGIQQPPPPDEVDLTPFQDATPPPSVAGPERPSRGDARLSARVHLGLQGGLLGATIGSFLSDDSPASGAIPVGLVAGLAAGYFLPGPLDKLGWSEAQLRTAGSGSVWGGVIGGLMADAVKIEGTTARHVLVGASIGSTVGVLAGAGLASRDRLTRGDVALIDTLAGVGAVGGLTMGMLMQPVEGEAYVVNSILGAAGGLLVGYIAAPQTNTTPRRMVRVVGLAAVGGGLPFLLYAGIADGSTTADERIVGALSSAGLVGGLLLGFRLTRDLDVGLDVREGAAAAGDDAPPAVIGRHSDGRWGLGAITVQPLSLLLAPQPGMTIPVLGGAF